VQQGYPLPFKSCKKTNPNTPTSCDDCVYSWFHGLTFYSQKYYKFGKGTVFTLYSLLLSRDGVTIGVVWISKTFTELLNCITTTTILLKHFIVHYSIHLGLSFIYLYRASANGFQWRTFTFLCVPERSPCLTYQLLRATVHNDYSRTYVLVVIVVSYPLAFPPITYTRSLSPQFVLHAAPISSSLIWSFFAFHKMLTSSSVSENQLVNSSSWYGITE
jgi:hypothetical protein